MNVLTILGVLLITLACLVGARRGAGQQPKPAADALGKYAGRYELETGLIPVSTLDVTVDGGELWMKPTAVRKRRLLRKAKGLYTDEVTGTPVRFGADDEGRVVTLAFVYEGEQFTARRVELPPPSLKGDTTFRLEGHAGARIVALAGTFNEWNQSRTFCGREEGGWVCRLDLPPGKHLYKFVVDGVWLTDPANPDRETDASGNTNSVLVKK